jgi:hypothetical protein
MNASSRSTVCWQTSLIDFAHRGRQAVALLGEGVEQLDDALAMKALVADAPRDDLAHALHLVEAREIHQHREAGEELKPLGEAAEHGERLGDVLVGVDAERGEIIVLVLHLLILKEHAIFALGMPIVSSRCE